MTDTTTSIPELDGPAVLDSELLLGLFGMPGRQTYLIMDRTIRTKLTQNELRDLTKGSYRLPSLPEYHIIVDSLAAAFPDGTYFVHGSQLDDILSGKSGFGSVSVNIRDGRLQQFHGMSDGHGLDAVLIRRPEPWKQLSESVMLRKVGATKIAHLMKPTDDKWAVEVCGAIVLENGQGKSLFEAREMVEKINGYFQKSQPGLDAEHYKKLKRNSTVIEQDHGALTGNVLLRVTSTGTDLDVVLDSIRESKVL